MIRSNWKPFELLVAFAAASSLFQGCDSEAVAPATGYAPGLAFARSTGHTVWSPAVRLESADAPAAASFNTEWNDGCPFTSRDGKTFFMASNRPGGLGGIDIWISTRASEDAPWGEPVNAGAPINSEFNDFCPTIDRNGHRFFFVSTRPTWAGGSACGGSDIYVTRFRGNATVDDPQNLGCEADGGPNSAADEMSPFPLPQSGSGSVLYFSSTRAGGFSPEDHDAVTGDQDIYMSRLHGGVFGPAELVPGVNSALDDGHPNVRRDGLEMFFFSTRPGGLGGPDIYSASRARTSDVWDAPVNLGPNVNSAAGETRPSLSWDGIVLYFGSNRDGGEGMADIYVTRRASLVGETK